MLPFGLKIAWFVLSLVGLLSNLAALPAWARALGGYWIPVVYFVANTVLQIVFCLGMTWRMNPFLMPKAFCTAQAILMTLAWYVLTGLSAATTSATALVILRSYGTRTVNVSEIQGTLRWRSTLLPILAAIPAIAFISYLVVSLKLHSVRPAEGMQCDNTSPTWVRLLSYAGIPLLFALPSFLLSGTTTALLLLSLNRIRGYPHKPRPDAFTALPTRRSQLKLRGSFANKEVGPTSISLEPLPSPRSDRYTDDSGTLHSCSTPSIAPIVLSSPPRSLSAAWTAGPAGRTPINPRVAQRVQAYHLPFSWRNRTPEPGRDSPDRRTASPPTATPSPIMFAPPSPAGSARVSPVPAGLFASFGMRSSPRLVGDERAALRAEMAGALEEYVEAGDSEDGSMRWMRDDDGLSTVKSELEFAPVESYVDDCLPYTASSSTRLEYSSSILALADRTPWYRSHAVQRLVFFQLFSSITQILATVSSLADIFRKPSTPSPFGTQHVALLLAAWGPCLAFGVMFPCARRRNP